MSLSQHLAKHIRDVHFGGNWTCVNLKETLTGVDWQMATTKVQSFNTIAIMMYHMNYYAAVVTTRLQGGPLDASDKASFELPPITSQQGWEDLVNKTWSDAEAFATLVEQLPEEKIWQDFYEEKYGNWYRNIQGFIEHTHYHLGQIVLIKKLIAENS